MPSNRQVHLLDAGAQRELHGSSEGLLKGIYVRKPEMLKWDLWLAYFAPSCSYSASPYPE